MVYLKYKDLDDLYHNFARLPFYSREEYGEALVDVTDTTTWMQDVVLETSSHACSLDMSLLNYTLVKWSTLLGKYIDLEEYLTFKEMLKKSTKKSITFNFKIHEYDRPACLISMVITRLNHNKAWKEMKVHYRSTEIFKKFAVDLILFNRLVEELNNDCGCEIDKITLFIPLMFYRADFLAELLGSGYYDQAEFRALDERFAQKVISYYDRYYVKGATLANYHTIQRKQKLKARTENLPSIPIESLSIEGDLKKKERKKR